ncbi:hypothetical protein KHA80_01340 [Anaerobacillus sp. HL2]|nr:hypothetical protein KHA80_01340 [Anaerobacillus sp. HL2]
MAKGVVIKAGQQIFFKPGGGEELIIHVPREICSNFKSISDFYYFS